MLTHQHQRRRVELRTAKMLPDNFFTAFVKIEIEMKRSRGNFRE